MDKGKRSVELEELWFEFRETYKTTGFKQKFLEDTWGGYAIGNELEILVKLRPFAEPAIYNEVKKLFEDWLLKEHNKKVSLTFKVIVKNSNTNLH